MVERFVFKDGVLKNPAYGRQSISWPMRIVALIAKKTASKAKFVKKHFFFRGYWTPFMSKRIQIWDHFFSLVFPKGFWKSKKFGHWILGSWGKNMFKWNEQRRRKNPWRNFFAAAILDNFLAKMFKSETTSCHYFSQWVPNL